MSNIPEEKSLNIVLFHGDSLEKNASVKSINRILKKDGAVSKEIKDYIENNRKNFDTKKNSYVVASAMGAGEYWGSNLNGDYFSEEELLKKYKSFIGGHYYDNHVNKDPEKAKGRIIFAAYNHVLHRIEIVIEFSKEKAGSDIEILDSGKNFPMSMGTNVDYDVCSICGNKAKKKHEYCFHIKNQINKILPDGRKVYMININPEFFEISKVKIGADMIAGTLEKVANLNTTEKKSEIEKNVVVDTDVIVSPKSFQSLIDKAGKKEKPSNKKEKSIIDKIRLGKTAEAFQEYKAFLTEI